MNGPCAGCRKSLPRISRCLRTLMPYAVVNQSHNTQAIPNHTSSGHRGITPPLLATDHAPPTPARPSGIPNAPNGIARRWSCRVRSAATTPMTCLIVSVMRSSSSTKAFDCGVMEWPRGWSVEVVASARRPERWLRRGPLAGTGSQDRAAPNTEYRMPPTSAISVVSSLPTAIVASGASARMIGSSMGCQCGSPSDACRAGSRRIGPRPACSGQRTVHVPRRSSARPGR